MISSSTLPLEALRILAGQQEETDLMLQRIKQLAAARGELSILEAGCGTAWPLDLKGIRYRLTGIDANADALAIRERDHGDLDRSIVGDLRQGDLYNEQFDVIYNSFVLEHVPNAELVLDNLRSALNPFGVIIVRIPDRRSVYGFLSRITPFWVHVLYKRYVAGIKTAGTPGHDPFPTIYDPVVSRDGMRRWCAESGMTIRDEVGWNYAISRSGLVSIAVDLLIRLIRILSLGKLAADHVNLTYVLEHRQSGRDLPAARALDQEASALPQ
jgi:2-polyprenyl-3-methyl-5-hydroxy-6-metoxy-1,4-benzoquinol methylase